MTLLDKNPRFGLNCASRPVDEAAMNRRFSRPRTSRPTELSPGPSELGFEFLLWRHEQLAVKRIGEVRLGDSFDELRLDRP